MKCQNKECSLDFSFNCNEIICHNEAIRQILELTKKNEELEGKIEKMKNYWNCNNSVGCYDCYKVCPCSNWQMKGE